MRSHFRRRSTIEPHRAKLLAHIKAEVAKGYTRSAAANSYAKQHGLHWPSVNQWCRDQAILTQRASLARMSSAFVAHVGAGGNQLEFCREHGISKDDACRLSRSLGYSMQLVHADEFAAIQLMRKRAAGGES